MTRTRIENASLSVHIYHMNVFSPVHSRTRAIALYRPASHGCSFVNGARKEYVCFAAAFFSSALIISHFVCPFLFFINLHPDFLHPHRLYTKIFARKYYISENQIRHFSDFKIFLFFLYSNRLFCRIIVLIVILCGLLCCVHFTQRAST